MVVFPHAKVNIGLFVTGKRSDGFHDLETVFYPIGLSDILEIVQGDGEAGSYRFENSGIPIAGGPEQNLAVKAYKLLAADYGLPSVRIHLHKIIPFGAGLGGGSADAAYMLKALNVFFGLHLNEAKLLEYAVVLGSDCAFFILDRPVFACGKGEIMQPLDLSLADYQLVLAKPSFGVSTIEAYAGIRPKLADYDLRQLGQLSVREWRGVVRNDFEETVFQKHPFLYEMKQKLYANGAEFASMTGSGSGVFGLFGKDKEINIDFPDCFFWKGNLKW